MPSNTAEHVRLTPYGHLSPEDNLDEAFAIPSTPPPPRGWYKLWRCYGEYIKDNMQHSKRLKVMLAVVFVASNMFVFYRPNKPIIHIAPKCMLLWHTEHTNYNHDGTAIKTGYGLGDYLYYSSGARAIANRLSCTYTSFPETTPHGMQLQEYLGDYAVNQSLLIGKACIIQVNVTVAKYSDTQLVEKYKGCSLILAKGNEFHSIKLLKEASHTIKESFIKAHGTYEHWDGLAIHMRWGDLATVKEEHRWRGKVLRHDQISKAIEVYKSAHRVNQIVIFAENYPNETVNAIYHRHTVDNSTDSVQVIKRMAGASVIAGARSGFLLLPMLLRGDRPAILTESAANWFIDFTSQIEIL